MKYGFYTAFGYVGFVNRQNPNRPQDGERMEFATEGEYEEYIGYGREAKE